MDNLTTWNNIAKRLGWVETMFKFRPHGLYCYMILSITKNNKGGCIINVKPCSYYTNVSEKDNDDELYYYGYCTLLKCEIDDQCKFCNKKLRFNKFDSFIWKLKKKIGIIK